MRSMRERPRRSTDHAATTSKSFRATPFSRASSFGRSLRPLRSADAVIDELPGNLPSKPLGCRVKLPKLVSRRLLVSGYAGVEGHLAGLGGAGLRHVGLRSWSLHHDPHSSGKQMDSV
jgi:hypothetical protein